MKDFFTRYQESHKHVLIIPALFGVMFSFMLVAKYNGTPINFGAIQASVIEANSPKIIYDADIFLERNGSEILLRAGKDALAVDILSVSLLADPNVLQGMTSSNPKTTIIGNEPGIFLIKVEINGAMKAGQIITTLVPNIEGSTPLTLIDGGFTSSGITYSMSTKGE